MANVLPWHAGGGKRSFNTNAAPSHQDTARIPISSVQDMFSVSNTITPGQLDQMKALSIFFGNPEHGRLKNVTDWAAYEKESSDYPEAFAQLWGDPTNEGKLTPNGHLSRVLIEKTKASESFPLSILAPLQRHDGSLDFTWDLLLFNKHMLDREPEQTLPRMLSSTRKSGMTSMQRYGICLMLECTFMETPVGRQTFLMNLEQMRIATIETMSYGAMVAMMEHKPFVDSNSRIAQAAENESMGIQDLNKLFQREVAQWGCVHKDIYGWATLQENMRTELEARADGGGGRQTTVGPNGIVKFMHQSHHSRYYLDGPSAENIAKARQGTAIIESRQFSLGPHTQAHDPNFRRRTIGAFKTMHDLELVSTLKPEEYETQFLDIIGYDQNKDAFYRFRYHQYYKYAGLWDFEAPNAPLTDKLGRGYMRDFGCYTWGQLLKKARGSLDYVVDKLMLLKPDKQQGFRESLRLLPADDPRVDMRAGEYPDQQGAPDFDVALFNKMEDDLPAGKLPAEKQFTAAQHRRMNLKRQRGIDDEPAERLEYEDYLAAKRPRAYGDGTPRTAKELFDQGARLDAEEEKAITNATSLAEDVYMQDEQGNVLRIPAYKTQAKRPRDYFTSRNKGVPAIASQRSPEAVGNTLLNDVETSTKKEWQTLANVRQDLGWKDALEPLVQRVQTWRGATDAEKVMVLRRIEAFVQRQKAAVTADELPSRLAGHLAPTLAGLETRAALRGLGADLTPIEVASLDEKLPLGRSYDLATAKPGWLNQGLAKHPGADEEKHVALPDAKVRFEDGQLTTVLFPQNSDAPTNPLPHDAFAATLAAHHTVVFGFTDMDAKDPALALRKLIYQFECMEPVKRGRMNRLAWSLLVSFLVHAAAGRDATIAAATEKAKLAGKDAAAQQAAAAAAKDAATAAVTDIFKRYPSFKMRIENVLASDRATTTTLLSQHHLQPVVQELRDCIRILLGETGNAPAFFNNAAQRLASPDLQSGLDELKTSMTQDAAMDADGVSAIDEFVSQMQSAVGKPLGPGEILVARDVMFNSDKKAREAKLNELIETVRLANEDDVSFDAGANEQQWKDILADLETAETKQTGKPPPLPKTTKQPHASWSRAVIEDLLGRASLASGEFWRWSIQNNVPVAFYLRLWNANKTFDMGAALRCTTGAATTYYQNPHFMMGEDPGKKMYFGHFTLCKFAVWSCKRWANGWELTSLLLFAL